VLRRKPILSVLLVAMATSACASSTSVPGSQSLKAAVDVLSSDLERSGAGFGRSDGDTDCCTEQEALHVPGSGWGNAGSSVGARARHYPREGHLAWDKGED